MNRRYSLTGALGVSLLALVLAAAFVLPALATLIVAAFGRGTGEGDHARVVTELVAKHQEEIKTYQDRFSGRSIFFKPPPSYIPPPPVKREEPKPPPPPEPKELPPPAKYDGPSPFAFSGNSVWFRSSGNNQPPLIIPVGEERNGIRVVSTDPPWTVKVAYKGGEFDVAVFQQTAMEKLFATKVPTILPGLRILELPNAAPADQPGEPQPVAAADAQTIQPADGTARADARPGRNRARPIPPRPNSPGDRSAEQAAREEAAARAQAAAEAEDSGEDTPEDEAADAEAEEVDEQAQDEARSQRRGPRNPPAPASEEEQDEPEDEGEEESSEESGEESGEEPGEEPGDDEEEDPQSIASVSERGWHFCRESGLNEVVA